MKTGNEHTSREFDQLLSLALLERSELFNETNNETMAQHIFTMTAEVPALENNRIHEKLNSGFNTKRVTFKWWMNVIVVVTIVGAIGVLIGLNENKPDNEIAQTTTANTSQPDQPSEQITLTSADSNRERRLRRDEEIVLPITDDSAMTEEEETPIDNVSPKHFAQGYNVAFHIPEPYYEDDLDVPFLDESDKKKNNKLKLGMFREIAKKKSFTIVPGGPAWRNNERLTVNSFYLQCSEVSNWQYNVFLNDLIIQERVDDYLAAKPVKGNWKAVGIPEFEETYAHDKGYEKFPVLNIPRSGAEMYCKWLSDEMNNAIDRKDIKWTDGARPDFRLPCDVEWLRAARGDHDSTMQFPWGYKVSSLQNAKGCYLCNFNYGISKDVLTPIESDGKNCISEKKTTRSVVTTAGRSIDTLVLGPEYCYNPTDFGHYCMMGNAAEMVWTWNDEPKNRKGEARAMGGSWYSHADNVRIESKEQFVGITEGNVNIGFRVVMTYR